MKLTLKTLNWVLVGALAPAALAQTHTETDSEHYAVVLPTVTVEAQADTAATKGYLHYDTASGSRTGLTLKETPQAIDIINIQKNKNYGTNDLSSILEGNAGIDATYDMRGESIYIRGFQADANDIYRNGVRESGQVRRSTANIERVEILKGPSSVLYGRSNGGGVINMVSKTAKFRTNHHMGVLYGSYGTVNLNTDLNQKLNDHWAVRLVGEIGKNQSFRDGVHTKNAVFAPSISYRNDNINWTGEYLYDYAKRVPDRNPEKEVYDAMGINYAKSFAHPNDYVEDKLQVWRSDLNYRINPDWNIQWQAAHRRAAQDFDHFYAGTFQAKKQQLTQNYSWQQTQNTTLSNAITLNGDVQLGGFHNHLTVGYDYTHEKREPILGFDRKITSVINPYTPNDTWQSSGRLLAANTHNQHQVNTHALFINNVLSVLPNVKVAAGGRYEWFTFDSKNVLKNQQSSYRKNYFNPNFGIVWDMTPQHTAYASYSKSFAPYGSTGYLNIDTTRSSETFNTQPETNQQIELGLKSSWFNNRLGSTMAVYQMEHGNRRYRPDPTDLTRWANRGKERSRGIELNLVGQVMPKWYVRGSLGYLDTAILSDNQMPKLVGRELRNTAKIQGNVFLRYTPNQQWFMETGMTASGKRYHYTTTANNVVFSELPGFARVDALIGYKHQNWHTTLAVNNVLNQKYWRSNSMPGNPRNMTLRVNYTF